MTTDHKPPKVPVVASVQWTFAEESDYDRWRFKRGEKFHLEIQGERRIYTITDITENDDGSQSLVLGDYEVDA